MTHSRFSLIILALLVFTLAHSQPEDAGNTILHGSDINGYIPMENVPIVDPYAMSGKNQKAIRKATGTRPDHVYNNKTIFFPPNINQGALGCCGSTSAVCYTFTHEWNAYRGVSGQLAENQFPALFTWLTSYQAVDLDEIMAGNGVPNVPTYGGRRESLLFGPQTPGDVDYGWMQGYDKWYSAMSNKLENIARFPYDLTTEQGREMAKDWLWNHCGDNDFGAGGCMTVGVAFGDWFEEYKGGNKQSNTMYYNITPSSAANKANGLNGLKFIRDWSDEPINHGMTIVGYDDRVEIDLNSDGVYSDDERGAWIIQNSHGDDWANGGWIYLPYSKSYGQRVGNTTNSFPLEPVRYYIRKDYTPKHTVRMKMDYDRRSELYIHAGISQDVSAAIPDYRLDFTHFKYMSNANNISPAPEVPMLGRWVDGMHDEPMEFGYDLTDLTDLIDLNKPYKIFIFVSTKANAVGKGNIYNCSIMDYTGSSVSEHSASMSDSSPLSITSNGKTTSIEMIIPGSGVYPPRNLSINSTRLYWAVPQNVTTAISKYKIYRNGTLVGETDAGTRMFTMPYQNGLYHVTAVYEDGSESGASNYISPEVDEFCTSATFVGDINGTYFRFIKEMVDKYSLTDIDMSDANVVGGGVAYSGNYKTIVNEFPKNIFANCTKLNSIILPKTITSIGARAFYNSSLKSVVMNEGLLDIQQQAFSHCNNLLEATLPSSLLILDMDNFAYSSSFKKLTLGPYLKQFGQGVGFANANRMTIYMYTDLVPTAGAYFVNYAGADVHIYKDMASAFESSSAWNNSYINLIADLANEPVVNGKTLEYKNYGVVTASELASTYANVKQSVTAINLDGMKPKDINATTLADMLAGTNVITYVSKYSELHGKNIVRDGVCELLDLEDKKDLDIPAEFIAQTSAYNRTFVYEPYSSDGNSWYSVVLPFDFDASVLNSFAILYDPQIVDGGVSFTQSRLVKIPAKQPFLLRPMKKECGSVLPGVSGSVVSSDGPIRDGVLNGTFTKIKAGDATGLLILSSDGHKFARATEKASIPAFRAYIDDSSLSAKEMNIIIDDEVTGVGTLSAEGLTSKIVDVYTIDGKLIRKHVDSLTALEGLGKGIYVVGGRKIVK